MYHAAAVDVPGPAIEMLAEIARESSAHLVVGVIELDRATPYCTVVFFDPAGGFLGRIGN
jgi:predicted amidohydrolase